MSLVVLIFGSHWFVTRPAIRRSLRRQLKEMSTRSETRRDGSRS
jgi:hypothetical protein